MKQSRNETDVQIFCAQCEVSVGYVVAEGHKDWLCETCGEGKFVALEVGRRDPRIDGPIGDAYARYDADPRVSGQDDFEAFADAVRPVATESLEDVLESTPWFTGLNLTRNDVDGGYLALVFTRPQGGSAVAYEKAEGPTIASAIRAAAASAKGEQS